MEPLQWFKTEQNNTAIITSILYANDMLIAWLPDYGEVLQYGNCVAYSIWSVAETRGGTFCILGGVDCYGVIFVVNGAGFKPITDNASWFYTPNHHTKEI